MTKERQSRRRDLSDPAIICYELDPCPDSVWDAIVFFGAAQHEPLSRLAAKLRDAGDYKGVDMLLGLARLEGNEERFNALAGEAFFESSDDFPSWSKWHSPEKNDAAPISIHLTADESSLKEAMEALNGDHIVTLDLTGVAAIETRWIERMGKRIARRLDLDIGTKVVNGHKVFIDVFHKMVASGNIAEQGLWDYCFSYLQMNAKKRDYERVRAQFEMFGGIAPEWRDLSIMAQSKDPATGLHDIMAPDRLSLLTPAEAKKFLASGNGERCVKKGAASVDFLRTRTASLSDAMALHEFVKVLTSSAVKVNFVNVNEIILMMFKMAGLSELVSSMRTPRADH